MAIVIKGLMIRAAAAAAAADSVEYRKQPASGEGCLNIYVQHILQTIIHFTKNESENMYLKNTPAPPPPTR